MAKGEIAKMELVRQGKVDILRDGEGHLELVAFKSQPQALGEDGRLPHMLHPVAMFGISEP